MNDVSRQFFALLSFLVAGSIVALLIGHAQATGQLLSAGLGGFNTLLNTIENPGGGSSSSTLGGSLTNAGNIIGGVGNLAAGIGNLGSGIGSMFTAGGSGGDFGSGITGGSGSSAGFGGGDFSGG